MTIYTDRHYRKVFYRQAPPTKPPTPMQIKQRDRFCQAIYQWKNTTPENRLGFEQITLRASLCMTGLNLWIHVALTCDFTVLDTLIRQTGISVDRPDCVPWPPGDGDSSS